MNGLRSHIKNSKECFIRYPNTSDSVKKTRLRLVFSTHFSGFGYPDETVFLVFDISQITWICFKITDFLYLHISVPNKLNCPFFAEEFKLQDIHQFFIARNVTNENIFFWQENALNN